jgi:hypothetical protein
MKTRTLIIIACCLAFAAIALGAVAPQAQAKTWKKISSLSASTNRSGGYFKLTGAPAKITYRLTADSDEVADFVAAYIYVMRKGTNLQDDGGFPVAMPSKEGSGSTALHLKKGTYYLDVTSANCSWTVAVWEKR